jgi:16S rRNA (uracil1498-N3)-methyltransferase
VPARFYVPDLNPGDPLVALPDEEAHHLAKVLRLGAGAEVRVFDGRGGEWRAEVIETGSRGARVRLGAVVAPAAESRVGVTLAVALLKGDRFDAVVRDAVMLGVRAIRPFVSAHTDVTKGAARARSASGRWARVAVSSSKQCGRAVVPAVHEVTPVEDVMAAAGREGLVLVEPAASAAVMGLADVAAAPPPASATLFVGPEGGWHADELAVAAREGCRMVRLGTRTLRADAVPVIALAALLAAWGEL